MQALQRILATPVGRIRLLLVVLMLVEAAILVGGPSFTAARAEITAATAAGEDIPWEADADVGIHLAAWINLGLLGLLAALAPLWARTFHSSFAIRHSSLPPPRWFWPAVFIAIALCTALRLPLASKSLWWDECWVMRQCSHGNWKPDKGNPEELKFTPTTWKRCAYYYQKPTNHVPMSLAQKASLGVWRKFTGAPKHEFSDLAARIPALVASAAAIVLIAWLLNAWGRPGAGVIAAVLLALHPWHIRYGVDARAYALVVPLCVSALLAATCILNTGGRDLRHWLWLGLNQFLWLWAYPNALIDIGVLFFVLAILLWRQQPEKADRLAALSRLVLTHFFAAMLLLQAFLPNFMQARHWAGKEADAHVLDAELIMESLGQLAFGVLPAEPDFQGASVATVRELWWPHVLMPTIASFSKICLLMSVSGLVVLLFKNRRAGLLALSVSISTVLFAMVTWVAQSYYYPRFSLALLPVFLIGIAWLCSMSRARPLGDAFVSLILLFLVMASIAVAQPIRNALLMRPYSPIHDVADFISVESKGHAHPIVLCYGLGREALPVYYPRSLGVTSAAEVEQHLQRAKVENRELFLVQGYNTFNRQLLPDGFRLIDDPKVFQEVAAFPGIEPEFFFRVFKAL